MSSTTGRTFKVMWLSQHQPLKSQMAALTMLPGFNEEDTLELIVYPRPISSAEEIVKVLEQENYDDFVAVVPHTVIKRLCQLGWCPLYAELQQCSQEESELYIHNRWYKFDRFRRAVQVTLHLETAVLGGHKKNAHLMLKKKKEVERGSGDDASEKFRLFFHTKGEAV